tara:strand:- start:1730 stop:1921 length:192 start_codon:yes stop_codon:yes gene_type:complete
MKYKFKIKEEGKEEEEKESMSFKKMLKSLAITKPQWTGTLSYVNKKGKHTIHNIMRGKKTWVK